MPMTHQKENIILRHFLSNDIFESLIFGKIEKLPKKTFGGSYLKKEITILLPHAATGPCCHWHWLPLALAAISTCCQALLWHLLPMAHAATPCYDSCCHITLLQIPGKLCQLLPSTAMHFLPLALAANGACCQWRMLPPAFAAISTCCHL
jgi:hypothetical protein